MLGAFEQNVGRKGAAATPRNFEGITREDVYRQRVLGRDSGMKDFIHVDDKRKLTVVELFVYIIFVGVAVAFCQSRVYIEDSYDINHIVFESLKTTPFEVTPEKKTFMDISTMANVKDWLVVALPAFVSPEVTNFNTVLGDVRFSLRRVKMADNEDPRFGEFSPSVWNSMSGITADSKETDSDDMEHFGAYRQWDFRKMSLDFKARENMRCNGGVLLDVLEIVTDDSRNSAEAVDVHTECKQWCETLSHPQPCRCFTVSSSFRCEFYFLPSETLFDLNDNEVEDHPYPNIAAGSAIAENGTFLFYPRMKQFKYSSSAIGYRGTNAYVNYLVYPSENDLLLAATENGGDPVPWTKSQMLANQVRDWVGGHLLDTGVACLSVDLVTFNTNYNIFTWTQIVFNVEPSGLVKPTHIISSLKIGDEEADHTSLFDDLATADYIYLALILFYCGLELWEVLQGWRKYVMSMWNLLAVITLGLNIATVASWQTFKGDLAFLNLLKKKNAGQDITQESITIEFETQMTMYDNFTALAAFTMLFLFLNLVHYLNDTVQRVKVLVDTMIHSMTPVIFFLIIILPAFAGAVVMANIVFGKSAPSFQTFDESLSSCSQMLFGQVESLFFLREQYPFLGTAFFIVYMLIFVFVLQNLPKAIVISSYDDACELSREEQSKEESRKRATEGDDKLSRLIRRARHYIGRLSNERSGVGGDGSSSAAGGTSARTFDMPNFLVYTVFLIMYNVMAYLMLQVDFSSMLSETVTEAIKLPTFETVMPVLGEVNPGNNFSTASSPEEVLMYFNRALPQTMFESSTGTLNGEAPALKTYYSALPMEYKQVVINNWNIVVGQEPVRITTKLLRMVSKMDSLALNQKVRVREGAGSNPVRMHFGEPGTSAFADARALDQVDGASTRGVLERRCNFSAGYKAKSKDDKNGFVCMLSVNESTTREILQDMHDNSFVTKQTASVVADFVLYNGFAEAFAYVAMIFDFQPSGEVVKNVEVYTVRLELFRDALSIFRFILEICVMFFTVFFLGQSIYRAICAARGRRDPSSPQPSGVVRCLSFLRSLILYLIKNPFTVMDITSVIMTVVTMSMWYAFVLSPFRLQYYFQEYPTWSKGKCDSAGWTWCTDADVIHEFSNIVMQLQQFQLVLGINTIIVFLRYLRFLQAFSRIRVIFSAFYHGMEDIAWFVIVLLIVLMGYVMMGNLLFGFAVGGLRNWSESILYCYEMFLGRFHYAELKEVAPSATSVFFFTYMILFRFMFINMFLAIINKQYHDLEKARIEEERLKAERMLADAFASGDHKRSWMSMSWFKPKRSTQALVVQADPLQASGRDIAVADAAPAEVGGDVVVISGGAHDDADMVHSSTTVEPIKESNIPEKSSWHILPGDMKAWSLEKSAELAHFIAEFTTERAEIEKHEGEPSEFDRCLEDAESNIKRRRSMRRTEALQVQRELQRDHFAKLREVHQDQESLSWYIMKRDAELKKLELAKELKQERFEKMIKAAKSLISADDDSGAAASAAAALAEAGEDMLPSTDE